MAHVTIKIQCDNTAFNGLGPEYEVGRILAALAGELNSGYPSIATLFDANGNTVGEYQLHE